MIGASDIVHTHAQALLEIKEAELLGVFNSDFGRTKNFAERYNIKAYQKLEDVLTDSEVGVVDIVGLPGAHADYGMVAARAGKLCYC